MSKLIYVADDEKDILAVIETFLINAGYQVKAFTCGDNLYAAFQIKPADLVILDIMLPGTDGLTLCAKIRDISDVPIIIISAKSRDIDKVTGITLGSDDYLVKPFSPMELVARIHSIFRRIAIDTGKKDPQKLFYEDLEIDLQKHQVFINNMYIDVTPTEYDFLVYLVKRPEKAVSREELLKNIWFVKSETGLRVTDDLVKRLRKKLRAANGNVWIETVWGFGFKLTKRG